MGTIGKTKLMCRFGNRLFFEVRQRGNEFIPELIAAKVQPRFFFKQMKKPSL